MNNYWAFASMRRSDDALGDASTLRARLAEDGYLYVPGVVPRADILSVRAAVLSVLERHGWVAGGDASGWGLANREAVREGDDEYFAAYDDIQRLEAFHTLAHHPAVIALMRDVLGESVFPHPLKVARLVFPATPEVSTPPHQDFPNNQGTPSLTAAWFSLGDCPKDMGPLAILAGSHRFGVLDQSFHLGPGNRQAVLPDDLLHECTWVTAEIQAGDAVIFPSHTVHAALNNGTWSMRVSADFRFQLEGEELTDMVLNPHFNRLTWDEIYEGWESDEFQYYWNDLDYTTIPFDRERFGVRPPTEAEIRAQADYEMVKALRHAAAAPAAEG